MRDERISQTTHGLNLHKFYAFTRQRESCWNIHKLGYMLLLFKEKSLGEGRGGRGWGAGSNGVVEKIC